MNAMPSITKETMLMIFEALKLSIQQHLIWHTRTSAIFFVVAVVDLFDTTYSFRFRLTTYQECLTVLTWSL